MHGIPGQTTPGQHRVPPLLLGRVPSEHVSRTAIGGGAHGHDPQPRDSTAEPVLKCRLIRLKRLQGGVRLRGQVCLVEHPPGVEPGQGGVNAATLGGELVPAEEQSGADHVQSADDDGGTGGIASVLGQVGRQAAPQPAHLKDGLVRAEAEATAQDGGEIRQRTLNSLVEHYGQVASAPVGVIDHHPAVNDDVKAQRDLPVPTTSGIGRQCVEPGQQDSKGLAHAGRDIQRGREVTCSEALGEQLLVGTRLVSSDGMEYCGELWRHDAHLFTNRIF